MFLFTGVDLLQSLSEFVSNQRDYFDSFEKSAKQINSVTQNFKQNKRSIKRKNNMMIAAHLSMLKTWWAQGINLRKIHSLLPLIIYNLSACLKRRTEAYRGILNIFECLHTLDEEKAYRLIKEYPVDFDNTIELTHLKIFVKNEEITPANIFEMIWKLGLATTFPNVYIELRIFLTLPVTNCEGERLFSTLSRVKNKLRSGLKQDKLCALSLNL